MHEVHVIRDFWSKCLKCLHSCMLLFCISVTGPRLNFSREVIHQRSIKGCSELDLIVICIHQYAHHSLERFLSQLTILVPYIHLDV